MNSRHKIAFNTANLVGRETSYRFKLSDWGQQAALTIAKTDERTWRKICAEIAAVGYTAVEIWKAHADSKVIRQSCFQDASFISPCYERFKFFKR